MSPLTKLFVVLLVVLSMLMTAATVVYVSKENELVRNYDAVRASRDLLQSQVEQTRSALTAAQQSITDLRQQKDAQVGEAERALLEAQRQVVDVNRQLTEARGQVAQRDLNVTQLTEGVRAGQSTIAQLQQALNELRETNARMITQVAELNSAVSDLTNRLGVTERERRFLAEQMQQMQEQPQQASATNGLTAAPVQAPNIRGQVQSTRMIGGQPYASISVGSADEVRPGMQFQLVDRQTGDFYGTLTVQQVEPNEAVGPVSGPRQNELRQGLEARTQ